MKTECLALHSKHLLRIFESKNCNEQIQLDSIQLVGETVNLEIALKRIADTIE